MIDRDVSRSAVPSPQRQSDARRLLQRRVVQGVVHGVDESVEHDVHRVGVVHVAIERLDALVRPEQQIIDDSGDGPEHGQRVGVANAVGAEQVPVADVMRPRLRVQRGDHGRRGALHRQLHVA